MSDAVRVKAFINHELVSVHVVKLDAVVLVPLLGQEISKDARYPSSLKITVEVVR